MNISKILETHLKTESNFVTDEGELKKWVVLERARNFDSGLIKLLLNNNDLMKHFFMEVNSVLVFKQSIFMQFLEQKNYLNDSHTRYKNKVGLTIDGKYLKQRNEVALVWPHKDCMLEGGQTHEEQKREEIFFNEILAQDEITQLLEPKVLTNTKVFNKNGEHAFNGFTRDGNTITNNLIIKGNNLLALHSLKKGFAGKVKLIYIDPPYNRNGDSFNYNDKFNHSTWLTFMKNRLEIAKVLLRDDGIIFVQCDDNEQAYLKVLMDQIFKRENFINTMVWLNKEGGGGSDSSFFIKKEEYALCFAKNRSNLKVNKRITEEDLSYNHSDKHVTTRGKYKLIKLNSFSIQYSEKLNYEITLPNEEKVFPSENGKRGCWRWGKDQYEWGLANDHVEFKKNKQNKLWVYTKQYFKVDYQGNFIKRSLPYLTRIDDFSSTTATKEQESLFGEKLFSYPKPEGLMQKIIEMATEKKDIILDYHIGSGTTIAVAHKMDRQYIGIEQMDYVKDIVCKRLKKVINNEQGGISKSVNWQGGGSFIYFELKKYNEIFINQINAANDSNALLEIWERMKEKSFLNYNIDIKKQEEHINDFKALSLEQQKQQLCELLDKNQLYVNLSSLYDKDFACSDAEKQLSRDFYHI